MSTEAVWLIGGLITAYGIILLTIVFKAGIHHERERFLNVEKDVEIIKSTQGPLLDKIEKNTEANIRSEKAIVGLTHSIDSLVKVQTEIVSKYEDHEDRIQTLELNDAVAQSGRDVMKWILRSIAALTVTGIGTMIVFVLKQYFTMKGN